MDRGEVGRGRNGKQRMWGGGEMVSGEIGRGRKKMQKEKLYSTCAKVKYQDGNIHMGTVL